MPDDRVWECPRCHETENNSTAWYQKPFLYCDSCGFDRKHDLYIVNDSDGDSSIEVRLSDYGGDSSSDSDSGSSRVVRPRNIPEAVGPDVHDLTCISEVTPSNSPSINGPRVVDLSDSESDSDAETISIPGWPWVVESSESESESDAEAMQANQEPEVPNVRRPEHVIRRKPVPIRIKRKPVPNPVQYQQHPYMYEPHPYEPHHTLPEQRLQRSIVRYREAYGHYLSLVFWCCYRSIAQNKQDYV